MKTQFTKLLTLSLCLLCFGIGAYAQGIKWTEGLNWEEVKAKAKAENKYIFVDCYATWCGPCKQMDKDVYPYPFVGEAVNEKFISVKIQMDSTMNDSENVKQYYATAKDFVRKYSIVGFPTYLFFSPKGEIVHKAMGFQKPSDFIGLVKDVQIPERQLYTQIKACRDGKMDVNIIPTFIQRLKDGGDKTVAEELARQYMKNYMEVLPEAKFATKNNIWLILNYQPMLRSDDRIYAMSLNRPNVIDSIFNDPGLADNLITNILFYDVILPEFDKAKKVKQVPNWKSLKKLLSQKSDNKHADKIILEAEHSWYIKAKNWDMACEYVIKKFQQKDLKNISKEQLSFELNQVAWTLFEYSFSKKQLENGLRWINEALALDESNLKPDAGRMDTKANLLYKLGRKEEAIALQEKAISLLKNSNTELHANLDKMRHGKPTWSIGLEEKRQVK